MHRTSPAVLLRLTIRPVVGVLATGVLLTAATTAVADPAAGRTLGGWGDPGPTGSLIGTEFPPLPSPTYLPRAGRTTGVIAVGENHVLAVRPDGTVGAWGSGSRGQFGDGTSGNAATTGDAPDAAPRVVSGLDGAQVVALAAGRDHSIAVLRDGTVRAWGDQKDGELGLGASSQAPQTTPAPVPGITTAVGAVAGQDSTAVLLADGTVRTFGLGEAGRLGNGSTAPHATPQTVLDPADATGRLTDVVQLAAGGSVYVARRADGTVRTWGNNFWRQLGDGGSQASSSTAVTPRDPDDPSRPLTGVTAVAAGATHVAASGVRYGDLPTLVAWGDNAFGQLAPDFADPPVPSGPRYAQPVWSTPLGPDSDVSVGRSATYVHSPATDAFYAFGSNELGQLSGVDAFGQTDPAARIASRAPAGAHRLVPAPLGDHVLQVDGLPATVDVTALAFGAQPDGTVSRTRTVTLTGGEFAAAPERPRLSGPGVDSYAISSDDCGDRLEPAAGCRVRVRFSPDGVGAHPATLTLAGVGREPIEIPLTGTGTAPPTTEPAAPGTPGPAGPAGPPGVGTPGLAGAPGPAGAGGPAGRASRVSVTCRLTARRTAVTCTLRGTAATRSLQIRGAAVRDALGRRATVRARLSTAGRRTARRGRPVRVSVTARVGDGTDRTTVTVRVPVRR